MLLTQHEQDTPLEIPWNMPPRLHWSPHGTTAVTALRAENLNSTWHRFWKNLALAI